MRERERKRERERQSERASEQASERGREAGKQGSREEASRVEGGVGDTEINRVCSQVISILDSQE